MKKILKWGGIVFIGLIVIGVIASLGKSGSTTQTSGSNNANNQNQEQQAPAKEPEQVTATQIADDFDGNQVAAESKWNGKYVQFTAVVSNITDSGLSFSSIGSKQFSLAQISCKVSDKQSLLSLKNGELVTVKGIIGKQTIGVIDMTDCEVVK
ncbi:MAG TPA: hypothetical protein VG965_05405 [Patescibacteria group bacterium]|nr:hypothetical protein [Patescibacteria group bacterium]